MKKIYSFIALMLLLFVGNAQAQTSWDVDDQNGSVATIEEGKKYAFHCGFNPGYGNNGYMHTAGGAMNAPTTFTSAYIFEFIKVSEKEANGEKFPVYILKNLGNGQYFKGGEYTKKKSEAFRFTARKATARRFADGDSEDWYEYSTQVIDQEDLDEGQNDRQNCRGAVEAGCWVFCSPEENSAIGYIGNGGTTGYADTRDWLIYEATEHQMTAYERLGYYYEMYCQNEVNEENYPIGTNPGYLDSQEYYNKLKAAYDAAVAAYANTGLSDDEYNQVTDALVEAFEGLNKHLVQVGAGYYMFIAQRSQDALRDSGSVTYAREWTAPESWTLANANVIWQVIPSGEEGKFYVKNFVTGKYLGAGPGTSAQFPLATDTVAKYTFEQVQGKLFVINQNGKLMHCDGGYKAVTWNDRAAQGNQHIINKVDKSILDSLQGKVDSLQNAAKWAALVREGQNLLDASEYSTDCTFDGNFAAAGLVSEAVGNHNEVDEGPIAGLFDNNFTTFYHTSWSTDFEDGMNDWIDLDLGKEVQHFFIKIARRVHNTNCAPKQFRLSTPEDGLESFSDHTIAWSKVLLEDSLSWDYSFVNGNTTLNNHVAIYKVDLEEPVQYLRFEVLNSVHSMDSASNQHRASGTPWWNASEFRVYENLGPDQFATFIPEEVKTALVKAIAAAQAEIEKGKFNEATYTALEEAIEAYNEAYPNPDALAWALEQAHAYAGTAVEGDDLGYFEAGAAADLESALAAVEAEVLAPESTEENIKVNPMSAADLKKYEEQVRDAVNAFFDKLHKPEAGKYYQITSGSDNEDINGAYVYAANADVEETAYWGYVGDGDADSRANTMWEVVDAGEGKFALKNVATGRYIYNPYLHAEEDDVPEATQINFSTTPEALTFSYAKVEGMFNLEFADGHYFNTDPTGNIATWYDVDDINARFQFTEVEAPGQYTFDVQPNALQVVSLPVDVKGVMVGENGAMKVLGQKDGMLQLQPYDENEEVIPAGTPFIVKSGEDEGFAVAFPDWASDFSLVEYSYESLSQNGLWAAVLGKTLPANVGIFSDNKIVLSDEEEYVAPGTGFVVAEVPETTEDGTLTVVLPEGLANGIHNAVIVRNNQAVYTINGVKVANQVSDLKNLPKGVYIIGGKKVVK